MALRFNYHDAALHICVDSTENSIFAGRIVSRRLSAPMSFSDAAHLLLQVDALLDEQAFPQAFQRIRTFSDSGAHSVPAARTPEEMLPQETVAAARGAVCTFILQVTSRQGATWQGFLDWQDGSPRQNFSSALEFLKLVDDRLFPC